MALGLTPVRPPRSPTPPDGRPTPRAARPRPERGPRVARLQQAECCTARLSRGGRRRRPARRERIRPL